MPRAGSRAGCRRPGSGSPSAGPTWWSPSAAVSCMRGIGNGIAPRRSVVAPNGVDVHRFVPHEQADARARLGLGDHPVAVCVGRLARQKGQDLLLRAWPGVAAEVPDAQLIVVGDGPDHDTLLALVSHGTPGSPGATMSPEDFYAVADVVVVPSRWEGMALVPLEAMACERSVVGLRRRRVGRERRRRRRGRADGRRAGPDPRTDPPACRPRPGPPRGTARPGPSGDPPRSGHGRRRDRRGDQVAAHHAARRAASAGRWAPPQDHRSTLSAFSLAVPSTE